MSSSIIVGGNLVQTSFEVNGYESHKLTFPGMRPRRKTDLIVLHWTGGEGDHAQMHATLRKRSLSVHFFVGYGGDVWQFCDSDMFAAHCRGANDRSIGIEIQNRADSRPDVHGKFKRTLAREVIGGHEFIYSMFTREQVSSTLALVHALCGSYTLPMKPPMQPVTREIPAEGTRADDPSRPVMDVIPRTLTDAEFRAHRGVIGHFHWTNVGKRDPGLALLRAVAAYGRESGCPYSR